MDVVGALVVGAIVVGALVLLGALLLSTTLSMDMSPVKPLPATPTKRTLLVPDGSVACGGRPDTKATSVRVSAPLISHTP